jgi:pimeloyl-ACP methyl ester carboxylesterase
MLHRRSKMAESQAELFYDTSFNSEHRPLVVKQMEMVNWQLANTPGYIGAILSSYRYFPLSSMGDLFAVAGRRQREVMIIWGSDDELFPWRKSKPVMEYSFPNAEIHVLEQCGHNPIFEKFEEIATHLAEFYKGVSYG